MISDIINLVNTYIGDSSEDRLYDTERYQALSESTAWLLEELGNEHMVDRIDFDYLPTVTWYKMGSLAPYLLTAGNLRFQQENEDRIDFQRVEARDLDSMPNNRYAYSIERYNGDSFLGIIQPENKQHLDVIGLNKNDGLSYTGTNAANIVAEDDAIRFDMAAGGQTQSGIQTQLDRNLLNYENDGVFVFDVEIPDVTLVTSVSIRFGDNLLTDYFLGTTTTDINGNPLQDGLNVVKIKWSDLTQIGTPGVDTIKEWQFLINHDVTKVPEDGFKFSDLRIVKPIPMFFKYIFYRVGKDASGQDITEFKNSTDIPFFMERYPQYRFAVAHYAASILFRSLRLSSESRLEKTEAVNSLTRFRKNFSGERDSNNDSFKPAGIRLRGRRGYRFNRFNF